MNSRTYAAGVIIAVILIAGLLSLNAPKQEAIRIGALLPLSGQNAVYGIEIKNSIELAKEEINAAGGINGKTLEVIYEDDRADAATGVSAMQKLVNVDKVSVVLGSWASGVVVATAPIAEQNRVVVMAIAISPAITNAGDYTFRIQPSALFYTSESARMLEDLGISTAGVIYINNEFGKSLKDAFVFDFEKGGGRVVAAEEYSPGDADFKTQLSKIKSAGPQVVFIAGYQETVSVVRQMEELQMESGILVGPTFESKATIDALGELAEDVLYPYHLLPGSEKSAYYGQRHMQKYGIHPGGFGPLMYDGVHILAGAMEKCGENAECIKEELYKTQYDGVTGKVLFDGNGDRIGMAIIMKTVKGGKFVPYR